MVFNVQALGYLSVNDTFDLNIVIRTAVFVDQPAADSPNADSSSSCSSDGGSSSGSSTRRVMTIGAGGAVTIQSDPESEFAEMQLKAERLLSAVALAQQQQVQQEQPVQQQQQQQASKAPEESRCMVRR